MHYTPSDFFCFVFYYVIFLLTFVYLLAYFHFRFSLSVTRHFLNICNMTSTWMHI